MKIIVINGISALLGGGQTNLINLMRYFSNYDCKIIFLLNSHNLHIFSKYKSDKITLVESHFASRSILHRLSWEKYVLPKKLKEWGADIYYSPGGTMLTDMPNTCKSITTLQNMLPFDSVERRRFPFFSYSRFKLFLLKFVFLSSYKKADKVIFISNYSRDYIKRLLPNIEQKSKVIPLGINDIFMNVNIDVKFDLPGNLRVDGFYLYVSHLDYYKCHKQVVKNWKKLVDSGFDYPLVLVGPTVNNYGREVLDLINRLDLNERVIYLGQVDYEKLPSLYQAARVLIFASACECCPNILLEMLASKKTILCSDKGPMPEFGEDGVVYFNPHSLDDLCLKAHFIEKNRVEAMMTAERAHQLSEKYRHDETIEKCINYLLN